MHCSACPSRHAHRSQAQAHCLTDFPFRSVYPKSGALPSAGDISKKGSTVILDKYRASGISLLIEPLLRNINKRIPIHKEVDANSRDALESSKTRELFEPPLYRLGFGTLAPKCAQSLKSSFAQGFPILHKDFLAGGPLNKGTVQTQRVQGSITKQEIAT